MVQGQLTRQQSISIADPPTHLFCQQTVTRPTQSQATHFFHQQLRNPMIKTHSQPTLQPTEWVHLIRKPHFLVSLKIVENPNHIHFSPSGSGG